MRKYYKLFLSIVLAIFIGISFSLATKTVNEHKAEISTNQFYTDDGLGSVAASDYFNKQSSKYDKVKYLVYLLDAIFSIFVVLLIVGFLRDLFRNNEDFSDDPEGDIDDSTDKLRSSYGK